jgi:uncharacterized membrane protein
MNWLGSSLSVAAMVGMIGVILTMGYRFYRGYTISLLAAWWTIPLLGVLGLGVSLYLAYTELVPCLGCDVWQYGRFFALIPIGQASVFGYLLLLSTWALSLTSSDRLQTIAPYALLAVATVRLLFAIYLTFLEPFVIGVACGWCLVSAVLTTIIFWLSAETVIALRMNS